MLCATMRNIVKSKNSEPVSFTDMMPADIPEDEEVDQFEVFRNLVG